MKIAASAIATFLGLGFFPVAPGTAASLAAALLYFFWLHSLPLSLFCLLVVALVLIAVWASSVHARALNQPDPRVIVIDEVCGQLATFTLVPAAVINVAAGFVLFRLFDVLKPYPIRRLERLPGGWGIVVDDLVAAVYGAALLHLLMLFRFERLT